MGKIILKEEMKTVKVNDEEKRVRLLDNEKFDSFNPDVLGLGDISLRSTQVEGLAAVFDLSGFTNFCSRIDPQLSVPEFLSGFLGWLFEEIKKEFVAASYEEGKKLWAALPFLAKFLGDGVLFLWDTENMGGTEICNVVTSLKIICRDYKNKFYQQIKKVVVEPPNILRCGIARGRVFSVGNGEDYVGPCINLASRLQKLNLLTFCVSRRGFDFEKYMHKNEIPIYVLKSVSLPGIGENELVWVLKEEFDKLSPKEKALFREP